MNDARADSPIPGSAGPNPVAPEATPRREPPGEGWPAVPKPLGEGWSRRRWLTLIALVFGVHVGLLFAFGEYSPAVTRVAVNVPVLQLAGDGDGWLALNDPTLFALPSAGDIASDVWLPLPVMNPPSFRWTEPLRWLALSGDELGTVFDQFMQTNHFAAFQLQLGPLPKLSEPVAPVLTTFAENSALRLDDGLARRRLLNPVALTNWPYGDVIAPSKVQVLVDPAGNVVSAALLPSDNEVEAAAHYAAADQRALELARAARFGPSLRLTFGWMIFDWRAVPPPATNAPATAP